MTAKENRVVDKTTIGQTHWQVAATEKWKPSLLHALKVFLPLSVFRLRIMAEILLLVLGFFPSYIAGKGFVPRKGRNTWFRP